MMAGLQIVGSLALVIGGLLVCVQLAKKYMPSLRLPNDLSVTEQLHLGDRCRIVVVKVRGQELLVGVTRENISILDKLTASWGDRPAVERPRSGVPIELAGGPDAN